MARAAVFLDRDGTLIEEINYISRPEDVRLLPGVAEALVALRQGGYACVLVTNQSGIGRGMFGEREFHAVNEEMLRQLRLGGASLDGHYFCPHAPRTKDRTLVDHPDRKPGPGMLLRAAREMNLDLATSWIVGDTCSDLLAGRNAGCRGGVLVRSGHEVVSSLAHLGDHDVVVDDLPAAARWILG